jgi:hypothetical protein
MAPRGAGLRDGALGGWASSAAPDASRKAGTSFRITASQSIKKEPRLDADVMG